MSDQLIKQPALSAVLKGVMEIVVHSILATVSREHAALAHGSVGGLYTTMSAHSLDVRVAKVALGFRQKLLTRASRWPCTQICPDQKPTEDRSIRAAAVSYIIR